MMRVWPLSTSHVGLTTQPGVFERFARLATKEFVSALEVEGNTRAPRCWPEKVMSDVRSTPAAHKTQHQICRYRPTLMPLLREARSPVSPSLLARCVTRPLKHHHMDRGFIGHLKKVEKG